MSERKDKVRRRLDEVWNQGNLEVITEVATPTFVMHDPALSSGQADAEGYREHVRESRSAFPDAQVTIEDQIEEGDRVVTRLAVTATHLGEVWGLKPTGKTVNINGILIERFEGELLAEAWLIADNLGMLQQLGVVPSMAS